MERTIEVICVSEIKITCKAINTRATLKMKILRITEIGKFKKEKKLVR